MGTAVQHQIVVIDDDHDILRLVEAALVAEGHHVLTFASGMDGMAKALDPAIDLVVLDLGLPDADGIEIARFLRSRSVVPILMLTGRADVSSRIEGLDAGADDYLPKPFNLDELCARVRSMLRRSGLGARGPEMGEAAPSAGGWRLDAANRAVVATNGQSASLTEREFLILAALMQRAGAVLTRDEILRQAAGRRWIAEDRSLDVHISRVRTKLREISGGGSPIKTVRGRGFVFEPAAPGA